MPATNTVTAAQAPAPAAAPAPRPPRRRIEVSRHLVLVNQPGWQAIEDLYEIAAKVRWIDPTIGTFVVAADINNSVSRKAAATRPTLVVSFGPLGQFKPARGKIYQGRPMHKFEQLRRLAAAGVPVPRTAVLTPELRLTPEDWGPYVVVKPTDIGSSSHGAGIQLMRTERVRYRAPEDYPDDHPGRRGPMLVQQFVDTGERISKYRVLTLFGQALVCRRVLSGQNRVGLDADDDKLEAEIVSTEGLPKEMAARIHLYDADVVVAARAAYMAIPEVPLQGCDVIKDVRSGRPYVLEVNPGGNTWHFSSAYLAEARAADPDLDRLQRAQFDAFATAAHVLVERTRAEAQ